MGMFDTYTVKCFCGQSVEFQSKAGDCMMRDYSIDNPPPPIVAGDLINQSATCHACDRTITIRGCIVIYPSI